VHNPFSAGFSGTQKARSPLRAWQPCAAGLPALPQARYTTTTGLLQSGFLRMREGRCPSSNGPSTPDLAIRRTATVGRDEFLDHMTFRRNDRPLFTEIFGPLIGLKEEWEAQGARAGRAGLLRLRLPLSGVGQVPVNIDFLGGPPRQVLRQTEDFLFYRDEMGRTMRLAKGVSTLRCRWTTLWRAWTIGRRMKAGFAFAPSRLGATGSGSP